MKFFVILVGLMKIAITTSIRPKRTKKPIDRLAPHVSHMLSEENGNVEHYNETTGIVIVPIMCSFNEKYECAGENKIQLAHTYSLKKGLGVFRASYFGIYSFLSMTC